MMPPKSAERLQIELDAQKARAEALKHLHSTGCGPSQRELLQQQQLRQKQTGNTTSTVAQRRVLGSQSRELSAYDKLSPQVRDNTLQALALRRAQMLQKKTQQIEQKTESYRIESKVADNDYNAPPLGWQEVVDPMSNDLYFWNETTNETVWKRPGNSVVRTKAKVAQTKSNELADEWKAVPDAASKDVYYWNEKTNETTWTRPVARRVSLTQALETKAKLDNILKNCGKMGDKTNSKAINDQLNLSRTLNKRTVAADNGSNYVTSQRHGLEKKRCRLDAGAIDPVDPSGAKGT